MLNAFLASRECMENARGILWSLRLASDIGIRSTRFRVLVLFLRVRRADHPLEVLPERHLEQGEQFLAQGNLPVQEDLQEDLGQAPPAVDEKDRSSSRQLAMLRKLCNEKLAGDWTSRSGQVPSRMPSTTSAERMLPCLKPGLTRPKRRLSWTGPGTGFWSGPADGGGPGNAAAVGVFGARWVWPTGRASRPSAGIGNFS